jgi:hypothetical protein
MQTRTGLSMTARLKSQRCQQLTDSSSFVPRNDSMKQAQQRATSTPRRLRFLHLVRRIAKNDCKLCNTPECCLLVVARCRPFATRSALGAIAFRVPAARTVARLKWSRKSNWGPATAPETVQAATPRHLSQCPLLSCRLRCAAFRRRRL